MQELNLVMSDSHMQVFECSCNRAEIDVYTRADYSDVWVCPGCGTVHELINYEPYQENDCREDR